MPLTSWPGRAPAVPLAPVLPSPVALGLPERFQAWRPGQDRSVVRAADHELRHVVPALPTGFGKSAFAAGVKQLVGGRCVILTSTKALQDQYISDFRSMGLVEVRGQTNYTCRALTESGHLPEDQGFATFARPKAAGGGQTWQDRTTCDEGPCHYGARCSLFRAGCHYYDAVRRATDAEFVVTNYAFWLATNAYRRVTQGRDLIQGIGEFDLLICDEAHDAPAALSEFLTSIIDPLDVTTFLDTDMPVAGISTLAWREWAGQWRGPVIRLAEQMRADVTLAAQQGGDARRLKRQLRKVEALGTALERLVAPGVDWIVEAVDDSYSTVQRPQGALPRLKFSPLWPAALAESTLFQGIPKVVLMSATITPKTMEYLGVPKGDYAFWEEPSPFRISRRPVYQYGNVRLKYPEDLSWWMTYIDQIIQARPGLKGIIHTGSFYRQEHVLANSRFASRLLGHARSGRQGRSLADALEEFRTRDAGDGLWLVSPSVTTGYDFKGDECRVQIIGKVPFPDASSALTKARQAKDKDYVNYLAMQVLVQAVGRAVRSEDDWAECFIVDRQIDWLLGSKYHHLSPKWFRDAVEAIVVIPKPLKERLRA